MKQISKRADIWVAIGIFVPVCLLLNVMFLYKFVSELSFYFTIWGAIFLSQLVTILVMVGITLRQKVLRIYLKQWVIALLAMFMTIIAVLLVYNINTPVLYPSSDTPQVTIANLCNSASSETKPVSIGCFISLVPPAASGIVHALGLNDPYNITKTQVISFVFCELLFIFFLVIIFKTRHLFDSQNSRSEI